MKKIAVIWAGPAGIFLSLLLKNFDWEVHLFEENHQIWKKLRLTWNWKMNITNKNFSINDFFSNEEKLLKNFFKNPLTKNPEYIFDEIWIDYFWNWNRAIVKNESSKEEVENLENILFRQKNLFLKKWEKIIDVKKVPQTNWENWKNWEECFVLNWNNGLIFDKIILSSWWMLKIWKQEKKSEVYSVPEQLWHTITQTESSLSPIVIKNSEFWELSWSAFFWEISDLNNLKNKITWDLLFTHKWLSWPAMLDFTANSISENVEINFFPNIKNLEEEFLKVFLQSKNDSAKNLKIFEFIKNFWKEKMWKNFTSKIINFLLKKNNFTWSEKISDISKKNFLEIRKNFFHLKINNCSKMDYQFCRTTKWGVNLKEININSLESKIHKNLFFAWEMIDINWLCWGFNISFAAICGKIIQKALISK